MLNKKDSSIEISQPFRGISKLSRTVDYFVTSHSVFAFTFASVSLLYPQAFSLFCKTPIISDSVTSDCIRLSSPFIFGFALFAYKSLRFPNEVRYEIAQVFAVSVSLATLVYLFVQGLGRWNNLLLLNSGVFAYVGFGYGIIVYAFGKKAFDREGSGTDDEKERFLKYMTSMV
eukprot:CAMPEP_0194355872 /NCGR_PEP_ID=MMETSP0174-20130528/3723_1 /TAXON_ID=216777 /ORGANISM="Proboscia alata, Strain PI-D3" /LENGTH=172 /DNA_ID=CAMNT_0039125323 /DNA_START=133 /DNA_END=651 /DNA_ORIENTATION=+